jgi:serine/threonine protein kinase
MLSRFDLEHELATAGRGAVYRGRETSTGRIVAVKLAPGAPVERRVDTGAPDRKAACLRLQHPHIAAIAGCGRRGELRYVAAELAPGADLAQHTRAPHLLPLQMALLAIEQVANALAYAHACGVVHGDVKPANIVFDPAKRAVKLVDFALYAGEAAHAATPAYLAPERYRGEPASAASDQFALGVTLFQLACGELPFRGKSRPQIVQRIVNEPHPDVRARAPSLPAGLAAIIDTALAKDPARRFASTAAMARAVRTLRARARAL